MIKAPHDAQPTATPVAEVAVSRGEYAPPTMDQTPVLIVGAVNAGEHLWTVTGPSYGFNQHEFTAIPVPETTYWYSLWDLWAFPDDLTPTPLDFGYGARLRDALRIGGDFDKAIAGLGLRERDVHE